MRIKIKIILQLIVFIAILAGGWYSYYRYPIFRNMVDDAIDYARSDKSVEHAVEQGDAPIAAIPARPVITTPPQETDLAGDKTVEHAPVQAPEGVYFDKTADVDGAPMSENVESTTQVEDKNKQARPPVAAMPLLEPPPPIASGTPPRIDEIAAMAMAEQAGAEARKQQALAGLEASRAAWRQNDRDKAIMLYWQFLEEFPEHPDFAGELGNIYFSTGQMELAANAYSEAFVRLLRNNDWQRARYVLGIVHSINPQQAAWLSAYFMPRYSTPGADFGR